MTDVLQRLAAPFSPDVVEWRVGSTTQDKKKAMALAYIDARAVQDRLDDVCGTNWACEHVVSSGTRVTCRIGVKVGDDWIWRSNGAGETDVEGDKGSYSDSFKRAAVMWRIGRYLYDLASPWVEIVPMGKSYKIADGEHAKLRSLLQRQAGTKTGSVTFIPPVTTPAPAPALGNAELVSLMAMGTEASERGLDILGTWWSGLTSDQRKLVGQPQLIRWKSDAAQVDKHATAAE